MNNQESLAYQVVLSKGPCAALASQSGTPQFASPEQLLGERVDLRSDLYSLAAVAVYALLGQPPFTGRNVTAILAGQTTDVLPDLEAERPDAGAGLARVLARALRADPEARYASANEFLTALTYAVDPALAEAPFWTDMAQRLLGRPTSDGGRA